MSGNLPKAPLFRLDGRRALVTEAGRGIRVAAASALAQSGAHVTLAARTLDEIEAAAGAIRQQGGSAVAMMLDVTDADMVAATIGAAELFDILVNNCRHEPSSRLYRGDDAGF
jgi:NADP-dependent 3-hydroxy acid dehydrogenase YdfG